METLVAIAVGLLVAASVYLMLSQSLFRFLIGIAILGNAVNLLIFTAGRFGEGGPPIVPPGLDAPADAIVNPLPQALILTAIVISFSLFAFALVAVVRAYETFNSLESRSYNAAEPPEDRA